MTFKTLWHLSTFTGKEVVVLAEQKAVNYYQRFIPGSMPFWRYLRLDWLANVASTIQRPILPAELAMLVSTDGPDFSAVCDSCGQKFTPVKWLDLLNSEFLAELEETKSVAEAITKTIGLRTFGTYYVEGLNQPITFCGQPYFRRTSDGTYFESFATKSCLAHYGRQLVAADWGVCALQAKQLYEQIQETASDALLDSCERQRLEVIRQAELRLEQERVEALREHTLSRDWHKPFVFVPKTQKKQAEVVMSAAPSQQQPAKLERTSLRQQLNNSLFEVVGAH